MAINNLNSGVGIQPTIVDAKGDLIVATGADAVNRLAVGTANQQLVVDSSTSTGLKWAAPAGLVLLNTTSFSGVASVSLAADTFTSTYDHYKILFTVDSQTGTGGGGLFARMRAAGTDNSTANYMHAGVGATIAGAADNGGASGQTSCELSYSDTTSNTDYAIEITVYNPKRTARTFLTVAGQKNITVNSVSTRFYRCTLNLTTSFDSMTIFSNHGGSPTITGNYSVYGVNK